jgi:hypothetical protein
MNTTSSTRCLKRQNLLKVLSNYQVDPSQAPREVVVDVDDAVTSEIGKSLADWPLTVAGRCHPRDRSAPHVPR